MADQGNRDEDPVVLLGRAPNAAIAGLWASMLEAAGIACSVPGTYLADEWAATQRMTGNVGSDVYVQRSRLEEARAIIAEDPIKPGFAEQAESSVESEEDEPPPAPSPRFPTPADPSVSIPSRRAVVIDALAVCAVTIVPGYLLSLPTVTKGTFLQGERGAIGDALVNIVLAIPVIALVRWLIRKTGEPPANFGWKRFRVRDFASAASILIAAALASGLMGLVLALVEALGSPSPLSHSGRGAPITPPSGWLEAIVMVARLLIVGMAHECAFHGYLMVRLKNLLGSGTQAVLISSLLGTGLSVHDGLTRMLLGFVLGAVFGASYFVVKRLWPLVLARTAFLLLVMFLISTSY